jgi:hypothetical protein
MSKSDYVRSEDEVHLLRLIIEDKSIADTLVKRYKAEPDSFLSIYSFSILADALGIDTIGMDLGFVTKDDFSSSLWSKIISSSEGNIIGPEKFESNWLIIRVVTLGLAGTVRPLESVKRDIETTLYTEMREKVFYGLVDSLKSYYKPRIDSVLWDSLLTSGLKSEVAK